MGYNKINWLNTIDTPLGASNLNHMDDGIVAASGNITNIQVLVDPANGSDTNGQFNDVTKPYRTLEGTLEAIPNGAVAEIFVTSNITLTGKRLIFGSSVIIYPYDPAGEMGTPTDPNTVNIAVTLDANCNIQLYFRSNLIFAIDTNLQAKNNVIIDSYSMLRFDYFDLQTFLTSLSHDDGVKNTKTATVIPTVEDVVSSWGASSSITIAGCDLIDSGITAAGGAEPALFNIQTGATVTIRTIALLVNGSAVDSNREAIKRFRGLIWSADTGTSYPVNFTSSIEALQADINSDAIHP